MAGPEPQGSPCAGRVCSSTQSEHGGCVHRGLEVGRGGLSSSQERGAEAAWPLARLSRCLTRPGHPQESLRRQRLWASLPSRHSGGPRPLAALCPLPRQWDDQMLGEACRGILDELRLPPGAKGGQVEFRHTLMLSLLFKFYLRVQRALSKLVSGSRDCEWAQAQLHPVGMRWHPARARSPGDRARTNRSPASGREKPQIVSHDALSAPKLSH